MVTFRSHGKAGTLDQIGKSSICFCVKKQTNQHAVCFFFKQNLTDSNFDSRGYGGFLPRTRGRLGDCSDNDGEGHGDDDIDDDGQARNFGVNDGFDLES